MLNYLMQYKCATQQVLNSSNTVWLTINLQLKIYFISFYVPHLTFNI